MLNAHETVKPSVVVNQLCIAFDGHAILKNDTQSRCYRALFSDIAQHFPNFVLSDFVHLLSRREKEGQRFYLEGLPLLGKSVETSIVTLEKLIVPLGWKLVKGTRLPKFLNLLFTELFEDDGSPRWSLSNRGQWNSSAVAACFFIRQVCGMWSKVETFTDVEDPNCGSDTRGITARDQIAFESFIERCTKDRPINIQANVNGLSLSNILGEAHRLLRCVFTSQTPELSELMDFKTNPWGRQGPGAVAGREVGCEKWSFKQWPGLPKKLFSWREGFDIDVEPLETQPDARLCSVPKDFRGPRIICIEPKENQFAQQGIMDILYRHVHACPLTSRSISFLDVEVSRSLCYNYSYATIDLKDASDLINLKLARLIFPRWVYQLVTRYRSRNVVVPGMNTRVKTNCLATMGNAVCFPLETLVFWALALSTMILLRDSFPKRQQAHLNLDLRVFGDDIIIPLWAADAVACALEASGLVVNHSKTCNFSPVRESCGEWVFMNRSVRTLKMRTTDVTNQRAYIQWRSQLSDFRSSFCPALVYEIKEILEEFLPLSSLRRRWNKKLQRLEIYAPRDVQLGSRVELVDAAGLYAWHVHNDRTPILKGARKRVKMGWQAIETWMSL